MINYILALIISYMGLVGGFILRYFAKEELVKIRKKNIWLVKESEPIYILLAVIFYFAAFHTIFYYIASTIFIYGLVVGSLKNQKIGKILFKNSLFLIAGLALLLLKS
ncbi:hypothetical protein ACFLZ7_02450 [Nanoarchaeota archaeon]